METHSSILGWKIPWTKEPSRLESMGLQRVRYSGGRNGNPFQNPCLDNLMDRGAGQATVQGATKSQLQLSPHNKKAGINVISFCQLIGDKIYK